MLLNTRPFEAASRVEFSSRCNMLMARKVSHGIVLENGGAQTAQGFVLAVFKKAAFDALEFDANGIIIALASSAIRGDSRMPRALVTADELPQFSIAPNIEVARHLHPFDALEVRVCVPVQLIGKQLLHAIPAIVARWQADGVQHDQINQGTVRTGAKVR